MVDLQALTRLFDEGDVRVLHDAEDDAFYLTAPGVDNQTDGGSIFDAAQRILRRVNGIASVSNAGFRQVQVTGRYGNTDRDGHIVITPGPAVVRLGGGQPRSDSPHLGRIALHSPPLDQR